MAQSIYFGGPILTMEEPLYAQALVEEDGVYHLLRASGGGRGFLLKSAPGISEKTEIREGEYFRLS